MQITVNEKLVSTSPDTSLLAWNAALVGSSDTAEVQDVAFVRPVGAETCVAPDS